MSRLRDEIARLRLVARESCPSCGGEEKIQVEPPRRLGDPAPERELEEAYTCDVCGREVRDTLIVIPAPELLQRHEAIREVHTDGS